MLKNTAPTQGFNWENFIAENMFIHNNRKFRKRKIYSVYLLIIKLSAFDSLVSC